MTRFPATSLVTALLVFSHPSFADDTFSGLGDFAGGAFLSEVLGVSGDGTTIVGRSSSASTTYEAFVWTLSGGLVSIGDLPGGSYWSIARGVNTDGSVIVGSSVSAIGQESFRWTEATGMVSLGIIPGGSSYSQAMAVNGDGSVVVGFAYSASGREPYRWTEATGMVGLGDLPGGIFYGHAEGVSADGSIIVGRGNSSNGYEAFRWTEATGMVGLGDLPGGDFNSDATAISADGQVIVGYGSIEGGFQAFRWTEADGMASLGDLPGGTDNSVAWGVNGDGSVIVGQANTDDGVVAFRWLEGDGIASGMQSIPDLLADAGIDLGTWSLNMAWDVSDDGRVIGGWGYNPDGNKEAWWAVIEAGFVSIEDFASSLGAMHGAAHAAEGQAGAELAHIMNVARHYGSTRRHAKPDTIAWGDLRFASNRLDGLSLSQAADLGRTSLWTIGGGLARNTDDHDFNTLSGAFGISHQATDQLRLGFGYHISDSELDIAETGSSSDRDTQGVSAYAAYEAGDAPLRLYAGFVTSWHDEDLARHYLNGVTPVLSRGSREGTTNAGTLVLGLEYPLADRATLMPFAGYEAVRIELDGYAETTGPFPATYDEVRQTIRTSKLGIDVTTSLGAKATIWANLAWAHRFDDEFPALSGYVPLLGSDFVFGGATVKQDWGVFQAGLSASLGDRLEFNISARVASDGATDPAYGGTIGFNLTL